VWGGHSCPPPLKVVLILVGVDLFGFELLSRILKVKVKSVGQECPTHTSTDCRRYK
jgi:hypothetical protein